MDSDGLTIMFWVVSPVDHKKLLEFWFDWNSEVHGPGQVELSPLIYHDEPSISMVDMSLTVE